MKSLMRRMFIGMIVCAFLIGSISACSLWTRSEESTATGTSEHNSSENSEGNRETEEIIRQPALVCDYPSVVAASEDGSKIILRAGSFSSFWINYYILDTEGEEKPVGIERPERYEIIGASFSPDGAFIVYESAFYIYIIGSDGTGQTQLVRGMEPVFSSDGTRIYYRAKTDTGEKVFSMNLTGSDVRQSADITLEDLASMSESNRVVWDSVTRELSIPGNKIISSGDSGLFIMNADGTDLRRLTEDAGTIYDPPEAFGCYIYEKPQELTSGNMLYVSDGTICVMNVDGTSRQTLTNTGTDTEPSFAPDQSEIVFVSERDGKPAVYIMNADGSDPRSLTEVNNGVLSRPAFSPDGTKIIYLTIPEDMNMSDAKINLIHSDGSKQKTLATGYNPKFLKGGDEILYLSDGRLYRMNADGSAQQLVTEEVEEISDFIIVNEFIEQYNKETIESCVFFIGKKDGVCNIYVFNMSDGAVIPYSGNDSPEVVYDHLLFSKTNNFFVFSSALDEGYARSVFIKEYFHFRYVADWYLNTSGSLLTEDGSDYVPVCLSPDEYKIIYVKNDNEIYMMDNDGTLKEKLADGHSPAFAVSE